MLHSIINKTRYIPLNIFIGKWQVAFSRTLWVNSSPPSPTYMRQWTGSALVQEMACRLFGATWTNADLLSIRLLGINFSEIWSEILLFSFKKMHLKMSSAKMVAILSRGRWVHYLPTLHLQLHVTSVMNTQNNLMNGHKRISKYMNKIFMK